eukprot:TRINITY_DN109_c0_g1_i1.p1 TRINITY_DN109_c0_g1~~TRINITY_DN109_c0_g1_i1.p1  ORF type:complete len:836 (+),score=131.49 TRINITY_DN109_c0_g1_i1:359-2866(+)
MNPYTVKVPSLQVDIDTLPWDVRYIITHYLQKNKKGYKKISAESISVLTNDRSIYRLDEGDALCYSCLCLRSLCRCWSWYQIHCIGVYFYSLKKQRPDWDGLAQKLEDMREVHEGLLEDKGFLPIAPHSYGECDPMGDESVVFDDKILDADIWYRTYRVLVDQNNHLTVVPSRIDRSSRLLRLFKEFQNRFLRVQFVYKGKKDPSYLSEKRRMILERGIELCGRRYEFLFASDSEIKWGRCWFYSPIPEVFTRDIIINTMGDFSHINSPMKLSSRLGMNLSVSRTVGYTENYEVLPDITHGTPYCWSDGCGIMSTQIAKLVKTKFNLGKLPSFIQIRYKGAKGLLTMDPQSNVDISLRPSMIKFESELSQLDVLGYNTVEFGLLNSQSNVLLVHLGIAKETIVSIQTEALSNCIKSMYDPKENIFVFSGNSFIRNIMIQAQDHGFDLSNESLFSHLLNKYTYNKIREVEKKSTVPLEKSRFAVGVLDIYGLLEENEVYFHCDDDYFSGTVSGSVFIYRSPGLHVGDLRVFKAVQRPEFGHLTNCVVFSQKGDSPSHFLISGSDLDGDTFLICWDSRIIPQYSEEPFDYLNQEAHSPLPPVPLDVNFQNMIEKFNTFQWENEIGSIFTSFTAFSELEGAGSENSRILASAFSDSVKFKHDHVDKNKQYPQPEVFPHFMNKTPSVHSDGILGLLFDNAENYNDSNFKEYQEPVFLDQEILEKYESHLDEELRDELQGILNSYLLEIEHVVTSIDRNTFTSLLVDQSQSCITGFVIPTYRYKIHQLYERYDPTVISLHMYALGYTAAVQSHRKSDFLIPLSFPWLCSDNTHLLKEWKK